MFQNVCKMILPFDYHNLDKVKQDALQRPLPNDRINLPRRPQGREATPILGHIPGSGLGIFTDRDQRSIFDGFKFRKSVFLGAGHWCCIFWVVK